MTLLHRYWLLLFRLLVPQWHFILRRTHFFLTWWTFWATSLPCLLNICDLDITLLAQPRPQRFFSKVKKPCERGCCSHDKKFALTIKYGLLCVNIVFLFYLKWKRNNSTGYNTFNLSRKDVIPTYVKTNVCYMLIWDLAHRERAFSSEIILRAKVKVVLTLFRRETIPLEK